MATLKGQNLRILQQTGSSTVEVIAMARSCTVTLNTNTEDLKTKDNIGKSQRPTVMSKGWSIQVESLDVIDLFSVLSEMKYGGSFGLRWDETSTTDNQTAQYATFGRKGFAILNDFSISFNNREISVKNLQFTGNGEISTLTDTMDTTVLSTGTYTRGETVRLYISEDNTHDASYVIAAARQLTLHISAALEDSTTKDTVGSYVVQEVTGISYDISTTALVRSGEMISSHVAAKGLADLETMYDNGTPVMWKIANASGLNNRTAGTTIISGSAIIQTLTVNAAVGQVASYTANLQGYGDYTVGA